MFDDGTVKEYPGNIVAEKLISVSGVKSNINHFLNEIVYHRKDGNDIKRWPYGHL